MQEDGQQKRDFVNIHDVTDAHLLVLQNKNTDYQVFNLGSGIETRVIELAKMVCEVAGTTFTPEMREEFRINSPHNAIMNIDKFKALGWKPKRSLENSVREYATWVRNYPEALRFWRKTYKNMRKENILK